MTETPNLDRLDAARGGPFWYQHAGIRHVAPNPVDMTFKAIFTSLLAEKVPGTPNMPLFKREALYAAWVAHYDLPTVAAAQRLAFVLERYPDDLEFDLRTIAKVDLGAEWRGRRWRALLATIDRLPQHSLYAEAVSKDPEHTRALAQAMANAPGADGEAEQPAPPLRSWTPEVALLTDIHDTLQRLNWTLIAVNAGKKAPKPPEARPRPRSGLAVETKRATFARRQAAHNKLAARLLPHKARPEG